MSDQLDRSFEMHLRRALHADASGAWRTVDRQRVLDAAATRARPRRLSRRFLLLLVAAAIGVPAGVTVIGGARLNGPSLIPPSMPPAVVPAPQPTASTAEPSTADTPTDRVLRLPSVGPAANGLVMSVDDSQAVYLTDPSSGASRVFLPSQPLPDSNGGAALVLGAKFSPDGALVALLREVTSVMTKGGDELTTWNLSLAAVAGGQERVLTDGPIDQPWQIQWSSDSRTLLLAVGNELRLYGIDGTVRTIDAPKRVGRFSFRRPDDQQILFTTEQQVGGYTKGDAIYLVGRDGSQLRRVADANEWGFGFEPWSAAGVLAVEEGGTVHARDLETGEDRALAPLSAGELTNPIWSPDGSRLLVRRNLRASRILTLAILKADGSGEVADVRTVENDDGARWSPDGSEVVVMYAYHPQDTTILDLGTGADHRIPPRFRDWQRVAP